MVPALNPTGQDSPRTGVPADLRGEILTPLPGDGPSLCDPLTGARRGGDVAGRSMRRNRDLRRPDNGRGCRHVPLAFAGSSLPRRKIRARPGKPSPSASVTHLALSRSCPSPAAAVAFPPVSGFGRCRLWRCCMIQLRREWGRFSNFSFRTPQRRISAYPARPSG